MGKKVRNREQRQVEDLMAMYPLTGRNRGSGEPQAYLALNLEHVDGKSWVKCKSGPFVCQAQPFQLSPAQRL